MVSYSFIQMDFPFGTGKHQIMANGTGLYGDFSSTQAAIVIPKPLSQNVYYIFTADALPGMNGFNYSVVDMSLQNNLGEVTQKNIPLITDTCLEKITAIKHCNGRDVWVMAHTWRSNQFRAFLVTPTGVSSAPVISNVGTVLNQDLFNLLGYMKASPDGKRIAAAYSRKNTPDFLELFDFNNGTGVVSNPILLPGSSNPANLTYDEGLYGVEFSPDGKLLYATANYQEHMDSASKCFLFQYDLSNPLPAAILASKKIIDSIRARLGGALQLAPDRRIYLSFSQNFFLGAIRNPNNVGSACNFYSDEIQISQSYLDTVQPRYGLPTFFPYFFRNPIIATGNCQFSNISFSLENAIDLDSVKWNFDDPPSGINNYSSSFGPTHIYSSEGAYNVTVVLFYNGGCTDTLSKAIHAGPFQVYLGNDTTLCVGDTLQLRMNIPAASNLWSTNSTDTIINVFQNGTYWIRAKLGDCTASDTIQVIFRNLPTFSLGQDTAVCSTSPIDLFPTPNYPDVSYLWNTGATTQIININLPGTYWLKIRENSFSNCSFTDTILVGPKQLPNFYLGNDTSICERDTIILDATVMGASGILWNTGAVATTIKVTQPGVYWVEVTKDGCIFHDSITITVNPIPQPNLGPDNEICGFDPVVLNPNVSGTNSYLWQNNSSGSNLIVNQSGLYWVKVTNTFGCDARDTISLTFKPYPQFTLGNDRDLCQGDILPILVTVPNSTNLWNTGSTSNQQNISQTGIYWLEVTSNGCATRDSLYCNFKSLPQVYLGRDTTLCEDENLLLDAGNLGSSYQWQNNSSNQTFVVSNQGVYWAKVTANGCSSSDTLNVSYDLKPVFTLGRDTGICDGMTILLQPVMQNPQGVNYAWNNGINSPSISITQTGIYGLTITNYCGSKYDEIIISKGICKIYVPSAFTPNNDGLNDIFRAKFGEDVTQYKLQVYNRWGGLVFETNDIRKGWDGNVKGLYQPNGVYVWMIKYKTVTDPKEQLMKGTVMLIR